MSRPGIEPGSQALASCAIFARSPQQDTTGPRHRAFDVFQGSCYREVEGEKERERKSEREREKRERERERERERKKRDKTCLF